MANVRLNNGQAVDFCGKPFSAMCADKRITITSGTIARIELRHGDQCPDDAARAVPHPQRGYLVSQRGWIPQRKRVRFQFRYGVELGEIEPMPWHVAFQLMPTPDWRDGAWAEPFPTPCLNLGTIHENGKEYVTAFVRSYPDKINKMAAKEGLLCGRLPLLRGPHVPTVIDYVDDLGGPNGFLKWSYGGVVAFEGTLATGSNDDQGPYPSVGAYRDGRCKVPLVTYITDFKMSAVR